VRSTAAPYTESRLTRSVANERVGFPVVEHLRIQIHGSVILLYGKPDPGGQLTTDPQKIGCQKDSKS
jgi:hypothetical protein